MNDVYYSVEPYTGDIICHKGLGAASPFTREAMRKRYPSFFANEEERKKIIRQQELRKKNR